MPSLSEKDNANLLGLQEALNSIIEFSEDHKSLEDFHQDKKTFDAVLMNFIVIGEAVIRLSEDLKNEYKDIPWQKMKSFRNVIAHDYFGINVEIVWELVQNEVAKIKEGIETILEN